MSLPALAVRRPITTAMLFLSLVGLGFFSFSRISQELYPDIALPTIMAVTIQPGAGPYDVEELVTKKVEAAVAGIEGVVGIESTSTESVSQVLIKFRNGTKMDGALTDLREVLNAAEATFPEGVEKSRLYTFSSSMLPMLRANLSVSTQGIDLKRVVMDKVVPRLERIPGVSQVLVFGGRDSSALVELDLTRLSAAGVPLLNVLNAFKGENVSLPGGFMRLPEQTIAVRTQGKFEDLEDIGDMVVASNGDRPVFLREVAEISLDFVPQDEYVFVRGGEGVRLGIRKQPGYNTIAVSEAVRKTLDELRPSLPPSLVVDYMEDQAGQVRNSIGGVAESAWQGGLLAVLFLLLFLRNIRSTLIIATTIPLSIIATFSLIDFAGLTLNISSLLGITLAVGMFVDNAIVVLESIYRKFLVGWDAKEASILGTEEVVSAVLASTLTTLAVFVPMLFIDGLAGYLFKDLSLSISFSLAVSLLAALTFVPMLASRFLKVKALPGFAPKGATSAVATSVGATRTGMPKAGAGDGVAGQSTSVKGLDVDDVSLADVEVHTGIFLLDLPARWTRSALLAIDNGYERLLRGSLRRTALVYTVSVLILAASVALVFFMGMEFVPETDEGRFTVSIETRIGVPYDVTIGKVRQAEELIKKAAGKDLVAYSSSVGDGGSHRGDISVRLSDKADRNRTIWDITKELDRVFSDRLMDVDHSISIEGIAALVVLSSGAASAIDLTIAGEDIDRMYTYALRVKKAISEVEGTRNVRVSHEIGKPELLVKVRRKEAASLGLSPLEVAAVIRTAYNGAVVASWSQGETEYDVKVFLREEDRNDRSSLASLFLISPRGERIALENVAEWQETEGPVSINRKDRERIISVYANLSGDLPLNRVSARIDDALETLVPPPGIKVRSGGSGSEMLKSFSSLGIALIIAIFLVYMVMAAQFEDFIEPLVIMASVPFAAIGLVGALLVTNTTLNILSFTGAILLAGVVVNNAIVLLDYVNTLMRRGKSLEEAIVHGGKTRLKPILMSVGTTVIGLIPMAMGLGAGAELRAPLARAVVGGLSTSTFITLVLVPCIFWSLKKRKWVPRKPGPVDVLPDGTVVIADGAMASGDQ